MSKILRSTDACCDEFQRTGISVTGFTGPPGPTGQQGPTGGSITAYVDLTTNQTINGVKTINNLLTPRVRPVSGNQLSVNPATDNGGGTAALLICPSSAGWGPTGIAQLNLGDSGHQVSVTFGAGMTITDNNAITLSSDNIKLGPTGTSFKTVQYGSTNYSTSLGGNSFAFFTITFTNVFATAPKVYVSLNMVSGGSWWNQCVVTAYDVTTTEFKVGIRNPQGTATSGSVDVVWQAIE